MKNAILRKLNNMKDCKQCGHPFEVYDEDLKFYEKVSPIFNGKRELIPPPTFCPDCRQQRRIVTRNERVFYKRKCDFTGKQIVSIYPQDFPGKVYDSEVWYGDKWDPCDYGRDFDFGRPFFEQFLELAMEAPRVCLINMSSENSFYTNHSAYNKNCYMCINSGYCEDMYYSSNYNLYDQSCADCVAIMNCERCYFCTNVRKSQFCSYLYECEGCLECHFCYDCQACKNCFGCFNLRHKQYCIYNKQYSREEYEEKMKELMPRTWAEYMVAFEDFKKRKSSDAIHKCLNHLNCQDCSGDHLENCKNVKDSYYVFEAEDCRYNYDSGKMKDCYDVTEPFNEEMLYEIQGSFHGYHNLFCIKCLEAKNTTYSQYCIACEDVFGCVGMHKKKFCVFNKQYSKEEYEELVPRIIEHMRETGEWGEFFPSKDSPFGYNETIALDYYPMSRDEVIEKGLKWRDDIDKKYGGEEFVPPDDIADVGDDICEKVIVCEKTGKPFKIIQSELNLYRRMKVPIPLRHPDERFKMRMGLRPPRKIRKSVCTKCGLDVTTSYSVGSVDNIYCEECYNKVIY